jgi:fructose-1,6-bisphosphatase I
MAVTLADRLEPWARATPDGAAVAATVAALAEAAIRLSGWLARLPLAAEADADPHGPRGGGGDPQSALDRAADALFRDAAAEVPAVTAYASEEMAEPVRLNAAGTLAVAVDPLDGSGNAAIGATLGSIFSILPAVASDPFLQPGTVQRAAGLALYGPQMLLVVSVGEGTDAFVLDAGRFVLARPRMHVPRQRPEFAVNASNHRHWEPAARAYVDDCLAGRAGPLGVDYNHRWLGCVAAEAYRVLVRGGLYLYPRDVRPGVETGRLRLAYEANPIAMLIEQAGGTATDGEWPILEIVPRALHQRVGLVFGSSDMVETVRIYHAGGMSGGTRSPLFARRGLFRE